MRIVFTVHQFLPEYSAGTEILTYETAKEFKKQGHQVSIFTGFPSSVPLSDNERFDSYTIDNIEVQRFKHDYSPMGNQSNIQEISYNNLLFKSYFKNYLTKEKPDLVHFFNLARLSASAIDVCKELNIPTVFTPTDFWFICPTAQLRLPNNIPCLGPDKYSLNCLRHIASVNPSSKTRYWLPLLPNWLLKFLIYLIKHGVKFDKIFTPRLYAFIERAGFLKKKMNQIDKIALPTHLMGKLLIQNGLETQRTFHLPFGLNYSESVVSKKITEKDSALRIGYIGTLAEYKGVHILLEAVKQLSNQPIDLKIYGKLNDYPDYVHTLKKIVNQDPRVEFCGTFPNSQIDAIFENLDVLVVPSLWYENSPLVIYSAQHAKCPVIASNTESMSEVIEHGKNGFLFEVGNTAELSKIIKNLIENRLILKKLSDHAKQPLSIKEYVNKLFEIYNHLIDQAGTI